MGGISKGIAYYPVLVGIVSYSFAVATHLLLKTATLELNFKGDRFIHCYSFTTHFQYKGLIVY